ncbi:MAG: CbiQ family ECF transporter T component [Anaerovoracaceae bacterium]
MGKLDRLDPRAKMVMIIAITTAAMLVENIPMLCGLFLFTMAVLLIGGVEPARQLRQARSAFGIVIFLFILQAVFGRYIIGAMLCIRLLIVIMSALILLTGEIRDYLLALVQMKIPYELVYMIMTGLHFFPVLREEALDVYYSIQLRGTEMKKASLRSRLKTYLKICLPILAGAMSRARDMSTSMEARAFRSRPTRTYMRHLTMKAKDAAAIIVFPLLCAVFIGAGMYFQDQDPALAADSPARAPQQVILSWRGDSAESQQISWKSCGRGAQYVRYATRRSYRARGDFDSSKKAQRIVVRKGEYTRCRVNIRGLKPDTVYRYSVGAGRKWSEVREFRTAPAGRSGNGSSFSFMSLGDVQYGLRERDYEKWGHMVAAAYKANDEIRFTLQTGDMVEKSPDMDDWNALFDAGEEVFSRIPLLTAPGNHETSITPEIYSRMTGQPEYYSFDYGNCHFVSLNSSIFLDERRQAMGEAAWKSYRAKVKRWLQQDLENSPARWKIVFMHHPAYPVVDDGDDIYDLIRHDWVPVFENCGVDVVCCGHQHVYMRTKKIGGVTYLMADSGYKRDYYMHKGDRLPDYVRKVSRLQSSYQIWSLEGNELKVRAYSDKGRLLDSFTVKGGRSR